MESSPERMLLGWTLLIFLLWPTSVRTEGSFGGKKLVCYYANWAIYRPSLAKFTPENINPFLCTHLIYAFAGMNKDYELKPFDSYNDVQLGNFKKFTNLKTYNPKLKVMIAVGGWNEGSKRFSKMVESSSSRLRFVRGAISFLRKHGFDGLDLDWEYPGSRDGAQDGDKEGYRKLVEELREAFDDEEVPRGKSKLLLTMAVPAGKQYIDKGFDVPALSKNLDFFNLLTYDYHTGHEAQVNHHAPLGEEPGLEEWSPNKQLNVVWTVQYYISQGCDPAKLVLGIPTYGRSFTLADPDETDLGAPVEAPGEKGNATREDGYLAYYEICQMIQDQDWELEAPYPEIMGPYAYKDNQWVGFDDEDIIVEKVKFIVREGLGGGMVWTLDNDDFRGKCYGEQSPLISTLKSSLEEGRALLDRKPTTTTTTTTVTPKSATQRASRRQSSPPQKTTTPPPFTTPDPGAPFECEDEGFFNNPTDCKKYFWCLDSGPSNLGLVAHAFTCPSGLFFNKQRDSCDYANNVVCRVKKKTTTVGTTPRPRPKPRAKKTTVSTTPRPRPTPRTRKTTTTTTTPPPRDIQNDLKAPPVDAIQMNGQSLAELLQLLQQLGVNQIHDKLQGRESSNEASTISSTLPEYRSPVRSRRPSSVATEAPADLFMQYAQPARTTPQGKEDETSSSRRAVKPRGPQFHDPAPKAEVVDHDDLFSQDEPATAAPADGDGFPFVYHTPSRRRSQSPTQEDPETEEEEEEEEDEFEDLPPTSAAPPKKQNRRVVVRVRPIPGERAPERNAPSDDKPESPRNRYVLAQTIGVRRQVQPNVLDQEKRTTLTIPSKAPPRRRFQSTTVRTTPITTTSATPSPPRYRGPPQRKELMVLATGKPAVPATTRRYLPVLPESRGPALALLPDGGITCLRRGVHPHPKDCAKFIACVPSEEAEDPDGFIHDCPDGAFFMEHKGRCMPGDRQTCSKSK